MIDCIVVHNFIRKRKLKDELFNRCDESSDGKENEDNLEGPIMKHNGISKYSIHDRPSGSYYFKFVKEFLINL